MDIRHSDPNGEEIFETFYENKLQKTNHEEYVK